MGAVEHLRRGEIFRMGLIAPFFMRQEDRVNAIRQFPLPQVFLEARQGDR